VIQFKLVVIPGYHYEVRWYTRKLPTETWAGIGALRMTKEDYVALRAAVVGGVWEIEEREE
jgi:hypothetical protein